MSQQNSEHESQLKNGGNDPHAAASRSRRQGIYARTIAGNGRRKRTALNKPEDSILAIVEVVGDNASSPRYLRRPFQREPDFGVTSANYALDELLARSTTPQ